jgi:hypothetical protein
VSQASQALAAMNHVLKKNMKEHKEPTSQETSDAALLGKAIPKK